MDDLGRADIIGGLLSEIHEAQAIEGIVLHVKGKRKEGPPALSFYVSHQTAPPYPDGTPPTHVDRRFVIWTTDPRGFLRKSWFRGFVFKSLSRQIEIKLE
jgi:hypothetical protein